MTKVKRMGRREEKRGKEGKVGKVGNAEGGRRERGVTRGVKVERRE